MRQGLPGKRIRLLQQLCLRRFDTSKPVMEGRTPITMSLVGLESGRKKTTLRSHKTTPARRQCQVDTVSTADGEEQKQCDGGRIYFDGFLHRYFPSYPSFMLGAQFGNYCRYSSGFHFTTNLATSFKERTCPIL